MLIDTLHGPMDASLLEKREPTQETPTGVAHATEYWLSGELVHRSVHFVFNADYLPIAGGVASIGA